WRDIAARQEEWTEESRRVGAARPEFAAKREPQRQEWWQRDRSLERDARRLRIVLRDDRDRQHAVAQHAAMRDELPEVAVERRLDALESQRARQDRRAACTRAMQRPHGRHVQHKDIL